MKKNMFIESNNRGKTTRVNVACRNWLQLTKQHKLYVFNLLNKN